MNNKKSIKNQMNKKGTSSNNILYLGLLILLTWYGFLTYSYISDYKLLLESDFRAFYSAGRISNEIGWNSVYDISLEKTQQELLADHPIQSGQLLTFNHPPLLLPVIYLITKFDYQVAYCFYFIFLLLVSIFCSKFLIKIFPQDQLSGKIRFQLLLSLILFGPLFISILKGQDTVILLAGLSIFIISIFQKNDKLAGLGLALTLIRPQISIFLVIPVCFYNRHIFSWYALGAFILTLYSYLMVGNKGVLDFINLMMISFKGQEFGLNPTTMFNLSGLTLRIFPAMNPSILNIIKIGGYIGGLIFFIIYFSRQKKVNIRLFIPLIISSLFFSPHLHYHDLAILLIPVIIISSDWLRQNRIGSIYLVNIFFMLSILFSMSLIITPLYFIIPYLVMLTIVLIFIKEEWYISRSALGNINAG